MASKWAHLAETYPRLQEDSDYQEKINVVKDETRELVAERDTERRRERALGELEARQHEERAALTEHLLGLARTPTTHAALVRLYEEACDEYDRIKAREKRNNLEIAALEQLLSDSMTSLGIDDGFKSEGYTYFKQSAPYPKVADKARLRAWLKETDQEELLSLNPQTLKGMVSEALGPTGSRVIPAGVEVFVKESISRRKR
jgi:hypothetical protein